MNIQEAAKLVNEGLLVRRSCWSRDKYLGLDEYGLYICASRGRNLLQMHFNMCIKDLIADDWELYAFNTRSRLSLRVPAKET